ncbi:hypothetical protein [Foetidibacter luteolus]|uniref:hypothetical protein n=1 Tax=Foetidibacter luteolus TaxID=2608880 RepID=UPI00129A7197|nr:hypothetical protein [Foetidibacter luteolus]
MTGLIIFVIAVLILTYFLNNNKSEKGFGTNDNDEKITYGDEEMTPEARSENFELKRIHFQQNTLKYFNFLVEEFGYNQPQHKYNQQDNGTIIKDELRYTNEGIDRLILIRNGYHPYDYGFDVCIYRPSISTAYSDDNNIRFLAICVSKESQDLEQTYLQKTANDFKEGFLPQIKGEAWFGE